MYSELKQKFRYKNPLRTDAIIKNAKECCKELRHSFFSDTLSSKYEWYFFPCGVYTGQLYISCFRKKERTGIEIMEWCAKFYAGENPEKYIHRFTEFLAVGILLCLLLGTVVSSHNVVPPAGTPGRETESENFYKTDLSDTRITEAFEIGYRILGSGRYTADVKNMCGVLSGLAAEAAADMEHALSAAGTNRFTGNSEETKKISGGSTVRENILSENGTADLPALIIPDKFPDTSGSMKEETSDIAVDIPEEIQEEIPAKPGDIPADSLPPSPSGSYEGTIVEGFLVDETGTICGIAEPESVMEGSRLTLPSEGCTAIASGAFLSAPEGIREIHIPANITHIEEGAFAGLCQLEWFSVESSGNYVSADGVLFSDGGTCLFAFPSARIGIYRVPSEVVRFASDAFKGAALSKLDARGCVLEDVGNVPEEIEILKRL